MKSASAGTVDVPVAAIQSRRTVVFLVAVWALTGASYGCVQPFLSVYAARRGLTLPDIGILGAISAGASALLQPVVGRLVDRTRRPRIILSATAIMGAVGCALLGSVSRTAAIIACATITAAAFYGARAVVIPTTMTFLEQARQGTAMFARYRVWPPAAFMVTGIAGGLLLSQTSFAFVFGIGAVFYLAMAVCGQGLPIPPPAREFASSLPGAADETTRARRILLTLVVVALLYGVATGCTDIYVPLLMRRLHGTFLQVALVGTIVTAAEVPLMIVFGNLADRARLALLLGVSMAILPLRFALMFVVQTPLQLLGAQLLDGPTFAAFAIVGVALLTRHTAPTSRASALGVYTAANTVGPVVGPLLGGELAARFGLQPMFGLFAIGTVLVPVAVLAGLWPQLAPGR